MPEVVATTCPACGGLVDIEDVAVGITADCPDCGALLEVVSVEPLTLHETGDPDVVPFPLDDEYEAT